MTPLIYVTALIVATLYLAHKIFEEGYRQGHRDWLGENFEDRRKKPAVLSDEYGPYGFDVVERESK